MKVKIIFITILGSMLICSLSQIFSIPPYAGDIFRIYKSGYFSELDKSFSIIKDSFLGIKTMSKPEFGWIFLQDIEKNQKIKIEIYDRNGYIIPAPGAKSEKNEKAASLIATGCLEMDTSVDGNIYSAYVPVAAEKTCFFCHRGMKKNKILGLMKFEREYDSHVYYSSERIIIFMILSIIISLLFFCIVKWDPEKKIKEMFDKS